MKLSPYDSILVKTKDGNKLLATIFGYNHPSDGFMCFPKYIPFNIAKLKFLGYTWKMLGEKWSRITYTPLVGKELKAREILKKHYSEFIYRDGEEEIFFVPLDAIEEIFYSRECAKKILNENPNQMGKIRKSTYELLNFLKKEGEIENVGITGSSLFSGEIDYFSDIDITLYGSETYHNITNLFKKTTDLPIHFRTVKEWKIYYEEGHYGFKVSSPFGKEVFAKHLAYKKDQFIVDGIEVTVFAVRNENEIKKLKNYQNIALEKKMGFVTLKGKVLDINGSMFMFPSLFFIKTSRGDIIIENYIRACISQAEERDRIEVKGLLKEVIRNDGITENRILVTPENKGYIINLDW